MSDVGGEDIPPDVVKAARKELVVEAEPGMTQPLESDVAATVNECLDKSDEFLGEKDHRIPEDVHRRMLEQGCRSSSRVAQALWEPHTQCLSG